jgi:hypothetical protein
MKIYDLGLRKSCYMVSVPAQDSIHETYGYHACHGEETDPTQNTSSRDATGLYVP